MKCSNPILIRNRYTHEKMFVNCGKCEACKISKANRNTYKAMEWIKNHEFSVLVTLTYDNKHLPYTFKESRYIIRNTEPFEGEILENDAKPMNGDIPITNSNLNEVIPILYYKDVQKLWKRVRINLDRTYGKGTIRFKYIMCGEMGSRKERSHYHAIILCKRNDWERIQEAIIQNWQLCDWSKLRMDKCFEVCNAYAGNYISGYVNSIDDHDEIFQEQRFKPKTIRSKDINFSITEQDRETISKAIKYYGDLENFRKPNQELFFQRSQKEVNNISSVLIPTTVFHAYFRKPRGTNKVPYHTFCRCCREVFIQYYHRDRKTVKSSNYLHILAYRRYLELMNLQNSAVVYNQYIDLFWRLEAAYKSQQLRLQMEDYPKIGKKEYITKHLKDSFLEREQIRHYYFMKAYKARDQDTTNLAINMSHQPISETERQEINDMIRKYKYKLLPKHFSTYYNGVNI